MSRDLQPEKSPEAGYGRPTNGAPSAADQARGPLPAAGSTATATGMPGEPSAIGTPFPSPADVRLPTESDDAEKRGKKGKNKKKKKEKKSKGKSKEEVIGSTRGIETMFRTSYQTHNDLSALADNKANIMISINGIIISILIASMAPGLGDNVWVMIATAVLLLGCLTSLVFAVLAARPRVSHITVAQEDARSGKANILFFGNFVRVKQEDYVQGMEALMRDTDRIYHNMAQDIYSLGTVLERKFRLLRVSYTAFMVGLVAGVLLLLVTYGFTGTATF
jgi:hypothetical protein